LKVTLDKVTTTKTLTVNILLDAIKDLNSYALKDLIDNNGVVQLDKYLVDTEQYEEVTETLIHEKNRYITDLCTYGYKLINEKNNNPQEKSENNNPSKDENPSVNNGSTSKINPSADESHKKGITKRDVLISFAFISVGAGTTKAADKWLTTDKKK
jgi:hypothetical protein